MDKNEILRYLRSKDMKNPQIEDLIEEVIDEIKRIAKPKYTYKFFEIEKTDSIHILNTKIHIKSSSLRNHLRDSHSIAVMAATLGIEVDRSIKINEKINLTKSLIMDAAATAYIEEICDIAQEEVRKESKLNLTSRFSPGYGDLKLEEQKNLIPLINAEKIGLTLTESLIMIPRKSVTAIIGLCDFKPKAEIKCENCNKKESCDYK